MLFNDQPILKGFEPAWCYRAYCAVDRLMQGYARDSSSRAEDSYGLPNPFDDIRREALSYFKDMDYPYLDDDKDLDLLAYLAIEMATLKNWNVAGDKNNSFFGMSLSSASEDNGVRENQIKSYFKKLRGCNAAVALKKLPDIKMKQKLKECYDNISWDNKKLRIQEYYDYLLSILEAND